MNDYKSKEPQNKAQSQTETAESVPLPPVEIPLERLNEETLYALIVSFIQREGTDYGAVEAALETKVKQIQGQLRRKEIKIVFDYASESVTLVTANEWRKFQNAMPEGPI